jgi:hypothetical protein
MVRHCPPRVILRWWLREPHIADVPGELLKRPHNRVTVTDLATRRIDDIRATFILPMSLSSNICSISGCSGQLGVNFKDGMWEDTDRIAA